MTTRLSMRQRITMMVNRYEIHRCDDQGREVELLAFAQQKRIAFKEQVTFYRDESRTVPVFSFKARTKIDLGATYDVTDASGAPIGQFRKDFKASLLRSTWHLSTPDGLTATGSERNPTVAIVRRVWELVPVVGEIPMPFLFHFDFRTPSGDVVLSSTRKRSIRDRYDIEVPVVGGRQLDLRVAAAMCVALDALQSR